MATQRCKTEKIDLNPSRVQNPFDHLKRSPGKFDQKIYMEQELSCTNNVKFYSRLYNTQQRAQLNSYDKSIAELQKRGTELRAQNEEYAYLGALRSALHKEKVKRQSIPQTARPPTPDEVRRRLNIAKANTSTQAVSVHNPPEVSLSILEDTLQVPIKPAATTANQPTKDQITHTEPAPDDSHQEVKAESEIAKQERAKRQKSKQLVRKKRPVSPNRLATLESLSYEIMTNTLPIGKMKRILPEESLPVQEKWPILSNYRKQMVLPSVKLGKQRLTEDMSSLHTKINEYFNCDNFPLWQYKYIPKDRPTKYKLLKAIETDGVQLPTLPKR